VAGFVSITLLWLSPPGLTGVAVALWVATYRIGFEELKAPEAKWLTV
jgi:hypothetical protein